MCSVKKVFLEILPNSQANNCARVSFLIKLQAAPATLLKKRLWHRCFPVNFAKFQEHLFYRTPLDEYEHLSEALCHDQLAMHYYNFRKIITNNQLNICG